MAAPQRVATLNRPNMVSVGTVVFLSQELMFFAGLFAMYFVSRANAGGDWPPADVKLDVPLALFFTIILVASSFTAQWGVFAAERGDVFALRRWYAISAVMGLVFLGGQVNEYTHLVLEGATIQHSVYGSCFYITTGFHAVHVFAGILAFGVVLLRTYKAKFTPAQATASIVVSYYWHFVDVVWIGVFTVIYLVQ